jgi:uncharacterized protein
MINADISNANIAFVQSLYAAFGRGDIDTIVAGTSPDVDWRVNGRGSDYPTLGEWKGRDGVRGFFADVAKHQEALEFSPSEFYAATDRVFVLGRYSWKVRKNGRTVSSDWVHVFTIAGGKVTRFREFNDTARFAEAWRS